MSLNKKNKTIIVKNEAINRKWWLVDARDIVLGRLASRVANILRGKDKPSFAPFMDTGDFVVVINADKIKVTGNKEDQKVYYRHSGYMGGIKETSIEHMRQTHPDRIITLAVRGMLPKNRLNRKILKKLKVYAGTEHMHQAQKPEVLKF